MSRLRNTVPALLLLALTGQSCAPALAPSALPVSVRGTAYVSGNEPFTALLLETDDGHHYVLELDADARDVLQPQAPVLVDVYGPVTEGTWNGRPYATLRVEQWRLAADE